MKIKRSIAAVIFFLVSLYFLPIGDAGATTYTLTLVSQGSGTVAKNPTNSSYPAGVTVTISATPNPGWYFANWSGDANSTTNPLNVTMNADLVVTGNFVAYPTYSITLTTNGSGGIGLNPPGGSYLSNTMVTATATPAAGWVFTGWSGATTATTNPVSFPVDASGTLTGTLAQLPAFDTQPASITNETGSSVTFTSHSVGTGPLSYQWYFSGGLLNNSTSAALSLTNVTSGQAGNYWVVATNNYGSATSLVVSLTLTNPVGPTNVVNSPDQGSLQSAIALGGWVGIGFSGTLILTNTITITNNVVLDGTGGAAMISGGNAVRLFYVAPGASFVVTNLALANGSCLITSTSQGTNADGGAIYNQGGTVTLVNCTLTNNAAQSLIWGGVARGGAVFSDGGLLTLQASTIISNSVIGGGGTRSPYLYYFPTNYALGGAIYAINGSTLVSGCAFNGNISRSQCGNSSGSGGNGEFSYATGETLGGAVFQASGLLTIANSSFAFNQAIGGTGPDYAGNPSFNGPASPANGGALAVMGGNITLASSQFATNSAHGGDAVRVQGGANTTGAGCGGAIYSASTLTACDCSFFGNQSLAGNGTSLNTPANAYGGAIYNSGLAVLNRCSAYSNYVQGGAAGYITGGANGSGFGGGVFNTSQAFSTNCTLAANSAAGYVSSFAGLGGTAYGGGIFNNTSGTFVAMNLTIASNICIPAAMGNQLANTNGILGLHNTLVAGTGGNAYGPITDGGYNICSDGSANLFSGSSYNFTDPQLTPLGDYGGPTLCMALLASSPAVDNGDSSGAPGTDQRGYARPFGSGVDMGAYEYGSMPLITPSVAIAPNGANVQISFSANPPYTYCYLQGSTNLTSWFNLSTNGPIVGQTNISQTISKQGRNRCYFRVFMQ